MDKESTRQNKSLVIKRTFNVPREIVWRAWTDPEQFANWWCPDGFTIPNCELEVRTEGKFRVDMQGPDGTLYPSIGLFKKVVEFELLSFTNAPLDNNGNKLFEVLQTVVFRDKSGQTELEITSEVLSETPEAAPYLSGMEPGLNQALSKLDHLIKQSRNQ